MTLRTDANTWAPRLVIVLQLAAWSVVGVVLLQRGATSLRGRTEDQDDVVEEEFHIFDISHDTPGRELPLQEESVNQHRVLRHPGYIRENLIRSKVKERSSEGRVQERESSSWEKEKENNYKRTASLRNENEEKRISDEGIVSREKEFLSEEEFFVLGRSERNNVSSSTTSTREIPSEKTDKDNPLKAAEKRKKSQISAGAGAVAAIVMLAIGVVMLLLGPAVLIIRAFDARRRRRERCSKSRSRRDLPPSYEQATLMDQAPRYSTLCLDAINEPSSFLEPSITNSSTTFNPSSSLSSPVVCS